MAFTAVAAVASDVAVSAGVADIATIGYIGMGMAVAGAATGNKTLSSIGTGMGLGALGADAFQSFSSGSTGFGDTPAPSDPSSGGGASTSPDSASSDPTTNAANNPTNSANLKTGTGVATTDAPLNPGGVGIQNSGGGLGLQANGNSLGGNIGGTIPTDPTGGTSQISLLPGGSGPQVAGAPAGGLGLNGGSIAGSPAAGLNTTQLGGPNSPSFFGSLTDAQGRVLGGVASGGLQMVGGMLNGMNQRDIANQQMALEQQRINQTSYGNTYANYQAPQSSGIINKAMA